MSDNLTIFGTDYTGVTGIKVKGTGNGTLTYVRPTGTKSITENGTAIDVTQYANVDVDVSTGPDWPIFTSNNEGTTIICDKTYAECKALIQDGVWGAFAENSSLSIVLIAMRFNPVDEILRYVYVDNGVPTWQLNYASDGTITMQDSADSVTSLDVIQNGTYSDGLWNEVEVNVPAPAPNLQSKTATPTEQQQIVLPDSDYNYDGLSSVTVNAIPSTYVGSSITQRTSSDLTASEATVTVPAGYYAAQASKTVASGTEGIPTATKSSISNHSVTITPSVTNSAGYIAGGTTNGTPVTVQASELVSGTYTVDSSGTKNVTNYTYASVPIGTEGTPTADKGLVSNHSIQVTPRVTNGAGWINGNTKTGTAVSVSASELVSGTKSITENGTTDVTNYANVNVEVPTGADIPSFEILWDSSYSNATVTCDKTFAECYALWNNGKNGANFHSSVDNPEDTWEANGVLMQMGGDNTHIDYVWNSNQGPYADIIYNSDGTINYVSPSSYAIELSVTQNGQYSPSKGVYTYVNVAVPSSGETLTITLTLSNREWVSNKTYAEVKAAYDAGDTIVVSATGGDGMACPTSIAFYTNYFLVKVAWFDFVATGLWYDDAYELRESGWTLYERNNYQPPLVLIEKTITANGTYNPTIAEGADGYSLVTVNVPSGGGDSGDRSDPIRFFDYDGTLVASYKSVPSTLPSVPTHAKLTNGTWNYTLAQITEQFNAIGTCDIGANYDTASGKNEIDITLDSDHLEPWLCVAVNGTATVDWGDGTTDTLTGTSLVTLKYIQHTYAQAGNYTISINGTIGFYSNTSSYPSVFRSTEDTGGNHRYSRLYCKCVTAIRVANGSSIGNNAFNACYALVSVSIPSSVTSIGGTAFSNCYALTSVTIPSGITSIDGSAFQNCYALASVSIPSSVTSIGNTAFNNCHALESITIPNGVTSIGNSVFSVCYNLKSLSIPSSVTSIGGTAFGNCYALTSVTIPSGITSIDYNAFQNCYALANVSIPSSVTSIGNNAFQSCYTLTSVSIPESVTIINGSAFSNCYGVIEYHLLPTTPPTLGTNVFSNIVSDTKIYVPAESLAAYQTATNWSTYASYMVGE